jgi:DNA-binding MarR family transcriptional regulator
VHTEPEICEHAERAIAARPAGTEVDPRQRLLEDTASFAREFHRWLDAQVRDDGLTMPGLRVVERIHCQGPVMMRTLADELGLSPRNVTALVDALEAGGLVERCPHPTDRRATLVTLTTGGLQAADALIGPRTVAMAALFDVLDDGERDVFARVLHRLRETMADGTPPSDPC